MIHKIVFLIALPFLLISCKPSQKSTIESREIILLLKDEVKPNELLSFDGIDILDQKRTSRSQNQWMVKLKLNEEEINRLKDQLSNDLQVLSVLSTEKSENENLTNN